MSGSPIDGYDYALQMHKKSAAELNMAALKFLRYLGEAGLLEHPVHPQTPEGTPPIDFDAPLPKISEPVNVGG